MTAYKMRYCILLAAYKIRINTDAHHLRHNTTCCQVSLICLDHSITLIQHLWKLANIVTVPQPNTYIDTGTSNRPMSICTIITKTF